MLGHRYEYKDKLKALQEKENAEKLITRKDYASARDSLIRAQHLFPLDHIVSMQTVCDILSASSDSIPGCEIDYYWILHLVPTSTISDIRHQYQKLVNLLEPIKTKFVGTELALKLIQDAFSMLSDSNKRAAFDSYRRNMWTYYESVTILSDKEVGSSDQVPFNSGKLCMHNPGERAEDCLPIDTHQRSQNDFGVKLLAYQETSSNTNTMNAHQNMAFVIADVSSSEKSCPINLEQDSSSYLRIIERKELNQDFYNFDDERKFENLKADQIWAAQYQSNGPGYRRYAQIINNCNSTVCVTWLKPVPVSDEERRWCEAGLPVACGSFCLDLEMNKQVTPGMFSYNCSWVPGLTWDQFDIYPRKGEVWALYKDWDLHEWPYNPDATKNCQYKLVEIISDFSKYSGADCACLVKVCGFRSIFQRETQEGTPFPFHISPNMLYILSHRVPACRLTGGEIDGVISGMLELDLLALPYTMIQKLDAQVMSKMVSTDNSRFTGLEENLSLIDPCPENEVLNSNQLLHAIAKGQIWGVHCERDSMPRQYVLVEDVFSRTWVCARFLEPEPEKDMEINWKGKNLPISCGVFRGRETTVNLEISQLSHPVKFEEKMSRYTIYPLKGQIWAMYQEWNCNWDDSDHGNCRYWILEILSDFSEGEKILVRRLGEVKGYFTSFVRLQLDGFKLIREVPRSEILSFSHEIPYFKVPGIGHHGIPESSWHLEPNALPQRL